MNLRIPPFRGRSLHGVGRRVGAVWRRLWGRRFVRVKRVRRIELAGRRYKRVSFGDAAVAATLAQHLGNFRDAGLFPPLVAVCDAELLFAWEPGPTLSGPLAGEEVARLATFFARLYATAPRRVPIAATRLCADLQRDLATLRDLGVLTGAAHRELAAAVAGLAPEQVWLGWDYLDPLPRNFVTAADGRLVAVDVEELRPDQLLGGGLAKCWLRSVAAGERGRLLAAVEREAALELAPQMPFAELHFLARWTCSAYWKGRGNLVQPAHFERFRET